MSNNLRLILMTSFQPVYGSWGPVGAALESHNVAVQSEAAYAGFHQANNVDFSFEAENDVKLAFDCKKYTGIGFEY